MSSKIGVMRTGSIRKAIGRWMPLLCMVLAGCATRPALTASTSETSSNRDQRRAETVDTIVPGWAELLQPVPDPAAISDGRVRAAITSTGLAWRVREKTSGVELLLVPPGTYVMGCSASKKFGCEDHESPRHTVTLTKPFYMGRFEVTQAQWRRVMGSNASPPPETGDASNQPVVSVSWDDVQRFVSATGLRLPTEAEWEYACRAGTTSAFPNGSDDDGTVGEIAWLTDSPLGGLGRDPKITAHDVGGKTPNALGLHDMLGNVGEWVHDWYDPGYYAKSPSNDPPGPQTGTHRVFRGGGFGHNTSWVRSSFRNAGTPEIKGDVLGFRVAKSP